MLYTTLGMTLFGLHNDDLQRACFKVYNDWVAEFSSHDRKRLIGIGLVSLEDIGEGIKELERCAKIGLRGAMIWGAPPREKPYHSERIRSLSGRLAQELEMPLSLHVITGKKPPKAKEEREKIKSKDPSFSRGYMNLIHEVQRSLTDMIFGGVYDALPAPQDRQRRKRRRLDSALHVPCGPCVREIRRALDESAGYEAERLYPPQPVGDLPGRSRSARCCSATSARTISCGRRTSRIPIRPGRIRSR